MKKEIPTQCGKATSLEPIEKKRNSYTRISLEDLKILLGFSPNVIYVKDEKARYVWANKRFEDLFKIDAKEIVGMTCREVFKNARAAHDELMDSRVLKSKKVLKYEECIRLGRQEHVFICTKFPILAKTQDQPKMGCIMVDITDQKKVQHRLKQLSAGTMELQEKERSAIACELHDELGQTLTFLKMSSQLLYAKIAETLPEAGAQVDQMCKMIDDSITTVRELSIRLRPKILDDLGILKALEWHTQEFENRSGIKCDFIASDPVPFNKMLATTIYRIAQEAMTNVAKHAKANHVVISLITGPVTAKLEVLDNGIGFDPRNVGEGRKRICLGLEGMRERASLVGGRLKIESVNGKGTRIIAELPINQ